MSKKTFKGVNTVLGEAPVKKAGRPKTTTKKINSSSEEGTKEGEIRATFIIKVEEVAKIKAISFNEGVMIKDIIGEFIRAGIERYEKSRGVVEIKAKAKKPFKL
jgi:hypothetical protein